MRPAMTSTIAAAAVVGSLVLAGCAQARPASPAIPTQLTAAALSLISHSGSYGADEILLHTADETLISRCMSAHGAPYYSQQYDTRHASSLIDDEEHPDMAWRRQAGYSIGTARSGPAASRNDGYLAELPPARRRQWERTLKGSATALWTFTAPSGHRFTTSVDGCIADSNRRLYGSMLSASKVF
jgi:hypothetical protein